MDSVKTENEEEGTESLTEEILIQVAEVCNMTELERKELLGFYGFIPEHREEDLGNQVLGENQDDYLIRKVVEMRKDEAPEKVIAGLHRDVEMVKLQLTDVKNIPSDDEIFAYLEAHLKEEKRIQIVADELRGTNTTESPSKNPSLNRMEANEQTGISTLKRKQSSSSDESTCPPKVCNSQEKQQSSDTLSNLEVYEGKPYRVHTQPVPEGNPYSLYSLQPTQCKTISHGNEGSHSSRPTLDIAEQMIQSVQEEDINKHKISSHKLNSNQEQMALPSRPKTLEIAKDGCKRMEVLVGTVLEMVPNIDQEYLRVRARDLVGHDAAIERFILEVLNDPIPPANWRQIFVEPFQQTKPNYGLVMQEKKMEKVVISPSAGHISHLTHSVPKTGSNSTEPLKLISAGPSTGASTNQPSAGPSTASQPNESFKFLAGPGGLAPQDVLPGGLAPQDVLLPGGLAPQDVLPGNLAPQDVLLGNLAPQDVLLDNLAPQDVLPGGLAHQYVLPRGHAPQDVLPGGLAPHNLLPGGLAPQNVLPEDAEEVDPEAMWQRDKETYLIEEVFPEYSPEWLVNQIQEFKMSWGTDDNRFNEHVALIMEMDKRIIPSRKEWEKQIKEREELDKWSGNMTVNDMIELYGGDPAKHFNDPKRKGVINNWLYSEHSRMGLLDAFRFVAKNVVDKEFRKAQNYSFALAHKALQNMPNTRKTSRPNKEINYPARPSIEFLKEKKFVELRKSIDQEKVRRDDEKREALEAARLTNALVECECCYNECLDQDMVPCNAGHLYCKDCVGESVNVAMGEGKTIILCLGQCEEEIKTRELQIALPPNVLSKLLSKRQADEVGAAEIENLVTCPFCPYSTIMENEQDKVVICRNPDCGRESCRLCREPNHIPLRCDEVKSKDEIRKRVEEALSDAIIRKCANPKCPASFMKTEGCNKMVCPKCRSVQCYLCKIIVTGYEHFYGQGGQPTQTRVCPLWQDNDVLHASEVSKAAEKEAEELKKDGVELEYNPKEGITFSETNK